MGKNRANGWIITNARLAEYGHITVLSGMARIGLREKMTTKQSILSLS